MEQGNEIKEESVNLKVKHPDLTENIEINSDDKWKTCGLW